MKNNITRMLYLFAAVFAIGCSGSKHHATIPKASYSGYASCDIWVWSSSTKAYVKSPGFKDAYFWYRDSLIINENYIVDTENFPDGSVTYRFSILSYTLLDMRTRYAYDFLNFSDTASCIKARVMVPDLRYGKIWAFLGEMPYTDPDSTVRTMTDTVMNNITYKRFSMYETSKHDDGDQVIYHYLYLNCNAAPGHRMFQFDKNFSRKYGNGCPIQWELSYYKIGDVLDAGGFVFHRDSLTQNEHKVFDAWGKYAKEYPVKD